MSGGLSLSDGFDLSGLTPWALWLRYASVGGVAAELEVEAFVLGLLPPDDHQYVIVAQALNEHFLDRGEDHPVAYDIAGADSDSAV